MQALLELLGFNALEQHQRARANWVDAALARGLEGRDSLWTESLAVGSENFIEGVRQALGVRGRYREVTEGGDAHMLREPLVAYDSHLGHKMSALSATNRVFWEQS